MRRTEFKNILDACITEIRSGRATIQECLRRHPGCASALEPLLRKAAQLAELPPVAMSAGAVDSLERRLSIRAAKLRSEAIPKKRSAGWPFRSGPARRRALRLLPVALSLVLVLAVAGTWTISASASSLPGESLYPVKLAAEKARLAITFRHQARGQLHLAFAERRLAEVQAVFAQERPVEEELLVALAHETTQAATEIEASTEKKENVALKLLAVAERQQAVLTSVQERAPEAAQKGLSRALEASQRGKERAMAVLGVPPEPLSEPSAIPSNVPAYDPTSTPINKPKPTRKPSHTPRATPTAKPTHKPTHTPKPTRAFQATPTRKPTHTPKPTRAPKVETPRTSESTEVLEPTDAPAPTKVQGAVVTPKPSNTRKPTKSPKPTKTPKPKG